MRILTEEETKKFYHIHKNLILFTNQRNAIYDGFKTIEDLQTLTLPERKEDFVAIHSVMYKPKTLDAFCQENPYQLSDEDLNIASSWRYSYSGEGYVYRHLANFTVLLFQQNETRLYGIKCLMDDLDVHFPNEYLPMMVEITLLPFNQHIIYDSFLQTYNIHFGGGIKRNLREDYNSAKGTYGTYGIYSQYNPGDDLSSPPIATSLKEQIEYGIKEASKQNIFPANVLRYANTQGARTLFEQTYSKEYVRYTKKCLKNNNDVPGMYYGMYRESVISVMPTKKAVVDFCKMHYPDVNEYITVFKG